MVKTKIKVGTGLELSTNNIITRFWSANHYGIKHNIDRNMFDGTVTDVTTGTEYHFNSTAKYLAIIEKIYKNAEKQRRKKKWKKKNTQ